MRGVRCVCLATCIVVVVTFRAAEIGNAQTSQTVTAGETSFPDLSLPKDADAALLESIVSKARTATPTNPQQFQAMQTAIRDASKRLLIIMKGNERSARYKQAELDVITSSVILMSYAGEEARKKTVEQVHDFLKSRDQLSLADVQTGFMAAQMFELQPFKKPARDTYQLLDDLLAEDRREDMQSFRLNLQAAVRRLDLLGEPLELEARSLAGRPIRVDQYQGKFLLVSFFDTRNDYCIREITRIKKHFEKYQSQGLAVIGIGLDPGEQEIQNFVTASGITWPIIHDNDANPRAQLRLKFGISKLPSAFLVNKEGTVVSLEAHGSELDRLMQMLFETPTRAPPPESAPAATPAVSK